ncbi:hypothetical protein [Actinocrispum wychmicini]|uniref:PPE family protein n=1 Tax=Actinocrispum wychmicini TaxID=1213861 RepID=A0A4R2JWU1_9PSEU|nr:hypothetical protein [Actinocrispum wychmicini]TCO58625.1 hypothetical protein EV192_105696 [Actinocrispum wychmicini]
MQGLLADLAAFYEGLFHNVQGNSRGRHGRHDDRYVSGGTNWNGYSLESLIKMVADQASPSQLQFLADTWRRQGGKLSDSAENLQQSLVTLMQYWTGEGADQATNKVATNSKWIANLGETATQIGEPVDDSGGALRSAQSTMPGHPKGGLWSSLGTAGGAAAAGFAVGGPFGAAAGAVIGGLASAFGFGNSKKKMKKKAVQTMSRYETAILGIDQATPQFSQSANGNIDPIWNHPVTGPGVGHPPPGVTLPGGVHPLPGGPGGPGSPVGPGFPGPGGPHLGTTPSFAESPSGRWASMTGVGPYGLGAGFGEGGGLGGDLARNGRMFGAGLGAGGGAGGMGLGASGMPMAGAGGYGMGADLERGASKYGRAGAAGRAGMGGGYGPGGMGAGANKEEDQEHRRRVPLEDDLFTGDLKAAPPVIGL